MKRYNKYYLFIILAVAALTIVIWNWCSRRIHVIDKQLTHGPAVTMSGNIHH